MRWQQIDEEEIEKKTNKPYKNNGVLKALSKP
jgi:hypothetical protein